MKTILRTSCIAILELIAFPFQVLYSLYILLDAIRESIKCNDSVWNTFKPYLRGCKIGFKGLVVYAKTGNQEDYSKFLNDEFIKEFES